MDDAAMAVWNRACLRRGGEGPPAGDQALAAMLLAHGLVMNGGVLHACGVLDDVEMADACSGFRYYGLPSVAELLTQGRARPSWHGRRKR